MDKGDVVMEDAEKKVPASDGRVINESPVKYENGVTTEGLNNKSESGVKSPIDGENGDKGQKNSSIVDNQGNAEDKTEDQSDSKGEDLKNARIETEHQLNSKSQLEAHGNVVGDDKDSSRGPNNANGDADENITGREEAQNQNKNENGEGELEQNVVLQNKKPTIDAGKDDMRSGNVQMTDDEVHGIDKGEMQEVHQSEKMIDEVNQNGDDMMVDRRKDSQMKTNPTTVTTDGDARSYEFPKVKIEVSDSSIGKTPEPATSKFLRKPSTAKSGQHSGEASKNISKEAKMADDEVEYEDEDDEGSSEDQAAFIRKLESFYRERAMEFKPPKFYGHPLNCLKLWKSVIRLGGYDRVTGSKLWRQVGESFNPPKTCTTVSWTFRIFYEKALLEYERHNTQNRELQLLIAPPPPDSSVVDNEGSGYQAPASGRARRVSAARAMQGWHEQRLLGYGEVGEPIVKDRGANNMPKREKNLKNIGSLKHKRQNEVEHPMKAARTETSKQVVAPVVDVGPPAEWVKINVRETKDCFEVYALVPGLLREEIQSDPAGRLVITGQPDQLNNPWGITAFKKVVTLPARINPLQTSAVVSLHGRLFVRVPFAQ
ncbi:AT-rich interactive domain-containing protein 5-like isoform X2 [Solanum dulcamara]|uniref:AT-rich interactive domain-containing protein 5-like isoform X2 n=1 Tax=Solanum dulcamara TaxID=45834 RepID=UPI002486C27B|nr:AT-rich interactive domain-containing protein 5-like isoform X2 [Solanum dulcamara]